MRYDYECSKCGHTLLNVEQSVKDRPKKKCPQCGKFSLERIFIEPPQCFVKGEPTTFGQVSERNIKSLGRYGWEKKKEELKREREEMLRKARKKLEKAIGNE